MWTAQTLLPLPTMPKQMELAQPHFRAHTLGWIIGDYRGHTILQHSGGVPGMVTLFTIIPEKHVAFALFSNAEEPGLLSSM